MKRIPILTTCLLAVAAAAATLQAAAPADSLTPDSQKIGNLLSRDEPDVEAALTVLQPYFDARYAHDKQLELALLVQQVARAAQGAQKEQLFLKAAELAKVTATDAKVPAPYRLRAMSVQGRSLYELGKYYQARARSTSRTAEKTKAVETSNKYLSEAVETFKTTIDKRPEGVDAIYALIDDLAIKHKIVNHPDPETQFTEAEKARLGALRSAMNQAVAESQLFAGWAYYYRAQNATQVDQTNPLPGLRQSFKDATARGADAQALTFGGLSLSGPWLYMIRPGMIPIGTFQADLGLARKAFRRFMDFAGGSDAEFFGHFGEAQVLYDLGRYDEAIELFGKVVLANPPEAVAKDPGRAGLTRSSMRQIAEAYFETGRIEQGKTAFKAMVDRFPDAAQDPDTLIDILALRSRAKALTVRKMAGASSVELSDEALRILNDATLHQLLVDPKAGPQLYAAVSDLHQLAGYIPNNPALSFALGASAVRSENFAEAIPHLSVAMDQADQVKQKEFVPRLADMMIWCYLQVDPPDYRLAAEQAVKAMATGTDEQIKAQFANQLMGIRYQQWQRALRNKNTLEAQTYQTQYKEALERLVTDFPKSSFARQASFRLAEARREEAGELLEQSKRVRGANAAEADKLLAEALRAMEESVELYDKLSPDSPYKAQALVLKGITAQRLGRLLVEAKRPNAAARRKTLDAGAFEAWQAVADPETSFTDEQQAASWRVDARIRVAQELFSRDDPAAKKQALDLLKLAEKAEGLTDYDRSQIAFQRFLIAQQTGNFDEAAEQLTVFQQFSDDRQYAGFAMRVFGHQLARRYRTVLKLIGRQVTPALNAEKLKLEKQIAEMLSGGYKLYSMPGLDAKRTLSVLTDLILVKAYAEAYPVAEDLLRHAQGLNKDQRDKIILLGSLAAMNSDRPERATAMLAQHSLANEHAQLFQMRAEAMTRDYEKTDSEVEARQKAISAITLWEKVRENRGFVNKNPEIRFKALYNLVRLHWDLGKTNDAQRTEAIRLATLIDTTYQQFTGADADTAAKLNEIVKTVLAAKDDGGE